MLKIFFWTMLLANGALYAYHQGYLDAWFAANHEPARMSRQLNADKIELIPAGSAGNPARNPRSLAPVSGEPAASQAVAATAPVLAVVETKTASEVKAPLEKKPEVFACTEVGNFSEADAARFEAQLATLTLGSRLSRRVIKENGSYMVFMPPQGNKENADRKIAQLRGLGVTEFYVIQDNPDLRWGISLGIFRTEEAAKARLAQLSAQGVRSARIGERNAASQVAFQLRDLDLAARAGVEKIKADYPQPQLRSCG